MGADRSAVADLIDGAIAGALATWAMGKVTTYLYEKENETARRREDEARSGKTAYAVASAAWASEVSAPGALSDSAAPPARGRGDAVRRA